MLLALAKDNKKGAGGHTYLKSAFECSWKTLCFMQIGKSTGHRGRKTGLFKLVPLHSGSALLFRDTTLDFKSDCKHGRRSKTK